MIYDDEQVVTNVASLNQMAKEYAKSIEQKNLEKLSKPLCELCYYQEKAQFCYNLLLKFAKQNAMDFVQDLLKNCTLNLHKIKNIITCLENKQVIDEASNNYVKIFKDALHCEIQSLKHCMVCQSVCKNSVSCAVLSEIQQCCEIHIEKLISCF